VTGDPTGETDAELAKLKDQVMTDEEIMLAARHELILLREQAKSMRRAIDPIGGLVPGLRALLPVRDLMLLAEQARNLGDALDYGAGERARPEAQ
jgi:hypothetical protein